jgi:hypothetical protein
MGALVILQFEWVETCYLLAGTLQRIPSRKKTCTFGKRIFYAGAVGFVTKYRTGRKSGPYKSVVPPFIII